MKNINLKTVLEIKKLRDSRKVLINGKELLPRKGNVGLDNIFKEECLQNMYIKVLDLILV